MKALIGFVFYLINVVVFVGCVVLSFKGFPFALISFIGYLVVMTAIGTVLGVWLNPGEEHESFITKIATSVIALLLLYGGNWIIDKGGLASLSVLTGDGKVTLTLAALGVASGVCSSILGTHKNDFSPWS